MPADVICTAGKEGHKSPEQLKGFRSPGISKEKSVVLSKGSCYSQHGAWGWGSAGGEKCVGLDPWSGRLKGGLCVPPASKGLSRSIFPL